MPAWTEADVERAKEMSAREIQVRCNRPERAWPESLPLVERIWRRAALAAMPDGRDAALEEAVGLLRELTAPGRLERAGSIKAYYAKQYDTIDRVIAFLAQYDGEQDAPASP